MAFIRCCLTTAVLVLCMFYTEAQTVFYPQGSSQLLKSTAEDAAMLLQKAIKNSQFSTQSYSSLPASGIIFIYDSTIADNQACRVQSDGSGYIKFSAPQDNGLCFGIYQYLQGLGFRFYQPGSIWELVPELSSPFRKTDSIYTNSFRYRTWFVSGGSNRWAMDNNAAYGWDTYLGENGHNLALYQRRNGMLGTYRFAGHRGDIMTSSYISSLQSNPCYVACYNNSRTANNQSVPDVNNPAAMNLWSAAIEQKYTQYRNVILNNQSVYINQSRNFNYANQYIGIEVPDGARWGNTQDNTGCQNNGYSTESDQQFTLANYTASQLSARYPSARFQVYAYSTHANIPSSSVQISNSIDVQLIPAVYQNITSTNGLRKRWIDRTKNISEYHYLNLSNWSGETPAFYLADLKTTVQAAKNNQTQGVVWEASPAKFASLPYLLAANNYLLNNTSVDGTLQEFCNNMFSDASQPVYSLLQLWADEKSMAGGISNKYRIPLYLRTIAAAESKLQNSPDIIKERLRELKAYLHYMVLYFDWAGDPRSNDAKMNKAADLCMYLAKTNRLQLVNSYYLISVIVSRYGAGSSFYQQYNNTSGLAYQNGNLPLITAAEIDNNFQADQARYGNLVSDYRFEEAASIKSRYDAGNINPLKKINVSLKYTNGMDYYNRSEFLIQAPAAGSFTINYKPAFDQAAKGYINFTVESTDGLPQVIKDFSLDRTASAGSLAVSLPAAGGYKLTVSSRYQSSVDLEIIANKNIFYKNGGVFGKATEIYSADPAGLPGYFYVPTGLGKVYFSLSTHYSAATGFASEEKINDAFAFTDNNGRTLKARFVTPNDSALFFIDIPSDARGTFCRITKKGGYDLVFTNVSNFHWFAEPKPAPCSSADFTISVISRNGSCITQLKAVNATSTQLEWEVTDLGQTTTFSKQAVVELPESTSPNAVVTLFNGSNCSATKRINSDAGYLKARQACASGAPLPAASTTPHPVLYPNPSTGVFNCLQNGSAQIMGEIIITNPQGARVAGFKNARQIDISQAPAGLYMYKMLVNGEEYTGKLVKR